MAKVITLTMLVEKKACQEQINLFEQRFGESVEITEDFRLKYSNEFDIYWLVDNTLNEKQRELYYTIRSQAWKEYEAIQGAAWEKYEAWGVTLSEAYYPRGVPALDKYEAVEAAAWKKYGATKESAHKAYKKEQAKAYFIAYNS